MRQNPKNRWMTGTVVVAFMLLILSATQHSRVVPAATEFRRRGRAKGRTGHFWSI